MEAERRREAEASRPTGVNDKGASALTASADISTHRQVPAARSGNGRRAEWLRAKVAIGEEALAGAQNPAPLPTRGRGCGANNLCRKRNFRWRFFSKTAKRGHPRMHRGGYKMHRSVLTPLSGLLKS